MCFEFDSERFGEKMSPNTCLVIKPVIKRIILNISVGFRKIK